MAWCEDQLDDGGCEEGFRDEGIMGVVEASELFVRAGFLGALHSFIPPAL
jgi:hypothetical protein